MMNGELSVLVGLHRERQCKQLGLDRTICSGMYGNRRDDGNDHDGIERRVGCNVFSLCLAYYMVGRLFTMEGK